MPEEHFQFDAWINEGIGFLELFLSALAANIAVILNI